MSSAQQDPAEVERMMRRALNHSGAPDRDVQRPPLSSPFPRQETLAPPESPATGATRPCGKCSHPVHVVDRWIWLQVVEGGSSIVLCQMCLEKAVWGRLRIVRVNGLGGSTNGAGGRP